MPKVNLIENIKIQNKVNDFAFEMIKEKIVNFAEYKVSFQTLWVKEVKELQREINYIFTIEELLDILERTFELRDKKREAEAKEKEVKENE